MLLRQFDECWKKALFCGCVINTEKIITISTSWTRYWRIVLREKGKNSGKVNDKMLHLHCPSTGKRCDYCGNSLVCSFHSIPLGGCLVTGLKVALAEGSGLGIGGGKIGGQKDRPA
jgi:hypothetical protein